MVNDGVRVVVNFLSEEDSVGPLVFPIDLFMYNEFRGFERLSKACPVVFIFRSPLVNQSVEREKLTVLVRVHRDPGCEAGFYIEIHRITG